MMKEENWEISLVLAAHLTSRYEPANRRCRWLELGCRVARRRSTHNRYGPLSRQQADTPTHATDGQFDPIRQLQVSDRQVSTPHW